MTTCSVKWCGNNSRTSSFKKNGITFHRFPKCPDRKSKWIEACSRDEGWFPSNNNVICSRHFSEDSFYYMKERRRVMGTAVPTLYLPVLTVPMETSSSPNVSGLGVNISKTSLISEPGPSSSTSIPASPKNIVQPPSNSTPTQKSETPHRKRKIHRIPTTPSGYDSPTKKRLCRRVLELENTVERKNKSLRQVRDRNRRLKRKIHSLKSLLTELENKNLILAENSDVLSSLDVKCKEIVKRQMLRGKSGTIVRKKYSPELRAFALTLNFYSTKAYKYVRKTFNTCLPSVKTLGKWYNSINGSPGFTSEAFEAIKIKVEQSEKPLYCCITFDEMKIRSKIEKTYGYVDFGGSIDSDCRDECTDALVFLVVPLHGKWKVPIGYFLINKITADQKVFLLTRAIELCNEVNIIVKAVTFDGCPANIAMAKKLGCSLNPDNLRPVFKVNNNEIVVFLDPAHMVKLVRNSFEYYKYFKNSQGHDVSWHHIQALHDLQEKEMFHAANKLRAEHMMFKKNIMKVKLATQLFSRSVATALLFCKNVLKLQQFQDVEATASFLLTMNDLFDILDSKVHGFGFKRALNIENAVNILEKLEECKAVLMSLTVNIKNKQVKLLDSPRFTGFLGLCIGIESAKFLYHDLIENGLCPYISFHRISQDHIELFFCNIRSHGGANDNPTPKQFQGIYKKMLVHMELQDTNTGNCVALEKISILHCTSAVNKINLTTERADTSYVEEPAPDVFIEALQEISLSDFSESIIEYISGAVVHYLIKSIKCNTCVRALVSLEEKQSSLIFARDLGGLIYPSRTVTKICKRCELVIRTYMKRDPQNQTLYYKDKLRLVTKTLQTFINEDIFPEIHRHQFDHESCNHVIELAKSVVEKYVDIRLLYLIKKTNPNAAIRRVYTKLVHFKNQ